MKLTESFSYEGADVESVYALISDQAFRTESCANQDATDYEVVGRQQTATVPPSRWCVPRRPTCPTSSRSSPAAPSRSSRPRCGAPLTATATVRPTSRSASSVSLRRWSARPPSRRSSGGTEFTLERRRQGVDPVHRQEDRARGRQGDRRLAARRGRVRDGEALASVRRRAPRSALLRLAEHGVDLLGGEPRQIAACRRDRRGMTRCRRASRHRCRRRRRPPRRDPCSAASSSAASSSSSSSVSALNAGALMRSPAASCSSSSASTAT